MESIAGWIAPVATMVAAMMTAANLGARITGWGFVVFMVGSVGWTIVGVTTGQTNLIASNGFLTLINIVGIWRWLGRQRAYEDGAKSAKQASQRTAAPSLFTATGIAGMPVQDVVGNRLGKAVEALLECATSRISYVVVSTSRGVGLDESLRAVPQDRIEFGSDIVQVAMTAREFDALPVLSQGDWPVQARDVAHSAD